jgi:hypothetical protein
VVADVHGRDQATLVAGRGAELRFSTFRQAALMFERWM